MKTTAIKTRFASAIKTTGLGLLGTMALATAQGRVTAEPAGEKPFVLFMGADIDVRHGKETYPVKNVAGNSFIIAVDQQPVKVSMDRGEIDMKITPQLKLSDKTAVVKDIKLERAYTPGNDPGRKWAASQSGVVAPPTGTFGAMAASSRIGATLMNPQGDASLVNFGDGTQSQEAAQEALAMAGAEASVGSDQTSANYAAQRTQEEMDKELFDAVRFSCEVSSPKPMRDPYIVIITQYRKQDDRPGLVRSWVFAQALERLDENPQTVRIFKGGFPAGFELLKQQVHLYGGGRELGTNVADKNVALTRDEAHQYIVIDHMVTHKDATLAPSVALGVSSKDFSPHFASEQLTQEIYVKVDKDGLPQGAFRDEKCTVATGDAFLESLVNHTRFKPALKAGKATAGVARLKIRDLAI